MEMQDLSHNPSTNQVDESQRPSNKRQSVANRYYSDSIISDGTMVQAIKDFNKAKKCKPKKILSKVEPISSVLTASTTSNTRNNYLHKVEDETIYASLDINIQHATTNKTQDDEEDKFIKSAIMIRNRLLERDAKKENVYSSLVGGNILQDEHFNSHSSVPTSSSGGLKGFRDLHAAVYQGMEESCATSLMELLDWDMPEVKKIGALCKVYWDGEHSWFDARILNYDKRSNKHYIYYPSDSTAEWISLSNESVLVAGDMCLVKTGKSATLWPSQRFQMSEKASIDIQKMKGYRKDCVFCENFIDADVKEYSFAKENQIFPLQEDMVPVSRRSKKFSTAMQSALAEQEIIDSVIETIFKSLRNFIFEALKGPDWINIRVRASTHRIEDGSVEAYPAVTSSFSNAKRRASKNADDSAVIPMDSIKISSAGGSSKYYQGTAFCVGTVMQYCPSIDLHLVLFDEPVLQPQWVCCMRNSVDLLVGYHSTSESISSRPRARPVDEAGRDGTCMVCTLNIDVALCVEILKPPLSCQKCARVCHSYCLPPLTFPPVAPTTSSASRKRSHAAAIAANVWTCWNCIGCSACKIDLWDQPLMWWNVNRIKSVFAGVKIDHPMLLCGRCLERYKHMKTFCPICFELYEDNPSDSVGAQGAPAPAAIVIDIDPMVQCNECFKWVHATCEGIDDVQYDAISLGTHPIWGDEYLCPWCRVKLASEIILQLSDQDTTRLFAEPVTTLVAKNYFDVIRNPMDLSTMAAKSTRGQYKSLQALRQDFELMCLNALVFNKVGDEYWNEARSFFICGSQLFDSQERKSHSTAYAAEIAQIFSENSVAVQEVPSDAPTGKKRKLKTKHFQDDIPSKRVVSTEGADALPSEIEDVAGQNEQQGPIITTTTITTTSNSSGVEEGESSKGTEPVDVTAQVEFDNALSAVQPTDAIQQNDNSAIPLRCEQLPVSVTAPPDPRSCLTVPVLIQSSEDAFFAMAQDMCGLCASAGSASFLIFCRDCGEAFHSFCVDVPVAILSDEEKLLWRCSNCKICSQCGTSTEDGSEGGRMIYCDRCDDAYHIGCLQPPLASVPKANESWFCARCVCCVSCKVDKNGDDHSSVWSYKLDMCIACHELEDQVAGVMNHLLSCCEKRVVEARTEDSSALYWAEETDSPDTSPTAAVRPAMPEKKEEPPVDQEPQQEAPDASEPASIKRARLKKLKFEKALEDVLSNVIQSSEEAEKEAKRSQIIAEFEAPNIEHPGELRIEPKYTDNCKFCGLGSPDLICSDCSARYHNHCRAGKMVLPFHYMHGGTSHQKHYGSSVTQFLCRFCVSSRARKSSGDDAITLSIATAILEVQLFRAQKRRDIADASRIAAKQRMNSHWLTQKMSLEVMVAMATCRMQWFESIKNLSISPSLKAWFRNEIGGEAPLVSEEEETRPAWLRHRAVRFMINWRRNGSSVSHYWDNRFLSGWKSAQIESDSGDSEVQQLRLARLAAGAAAFIHCTYSDMPASQKNHEMAEVARFLSCAYAEERKFSLESPDANDVAREVVRAAQKSLLCPPIGFRDNRSDFAMRMADKPTVGQSSSNQQVRSEAIMFRLPDELLHRSNMSSRATDAAKKCKSTAMTTLMRAQEACALRQAAELAEAELQKIMAVTAKAARDREKAGYKSKKKAPKHQVLANLPKKSSAVDGQATTSNGASEIVNESIDQFMSVCLECGPGYYGQKAAQQCKTVMKPQLGDSSEKDWAELYVEIQSSVQRARECAINNVSTKIEQEVTTEHTELTTVAVAGGGDDQATASEPAGLNSNPTLVSSSEEIVGEPTATGPMEVEISVPVDPLQTTEDAADAQIVIPMEATSLLTIESSQQVTVFVESECAVGDDTVVALTSADEAATAAAKDENEATAPSVDTSPLLSSYHNYGAYAMQGSSLSMSYEQSEGDRNLLSTPKATAWVDTRICCMCKDGVEDTVVGRMMTLSNGSHVHLNCLRWSCGVETADGVLADARDAIERSLKQLCFLCKQRGAGLSCVSRKFKDAKIKRIDKESGMYTASGKLVRCRRFFHVRCALACNVLMLETKRKGNDSKSEQQPHDVHLLCFCPEHVLNVMSTQQLQTFKPWQPLLTVPMPEEHEQKGDDGVRRSLLLPWDVMFVEQAASSSSAAGEKLPDSAEQGPAASPVAELLAQKRPDKSFRMGSLTIHHLGSLPLLEDWLRSPSVQGLFTENYIYPHRFRSSRIHWSMLQPRPQRSLYDFEVLLQRDFDSLADRTVQYVSQSLTLTAQLVLCWSKIGLALESGQEIDNEVRTCLSIMRLLTGTDYALGPTGAEDSLSLTSEEIELIRHFNAQYGQRVVADSQILFRLICVENPSHPIYSDSIDTLFCLVLFAVYRVNRSGLRKRGAERKSDPQHAVYGLNAHQFFGLGIPFVRHAIELLPESAATMVDLTSTKGSEEVKLSCDTLYRPSFVLPTSADIDRLKSMGQQDAYTFSKQKGYAKVIENRSGCSRAEVVQAREHSGPTQIRSLTRILTKMVEQPAAAVEGDKVEIPESPEDDEEANQQNIRLKYYEMSQAYLRQPDLKLRVQRSGIHGYGLFAQMSFEKNDVIVEYIGQKIRQAVADKREAAYEQEGVGSCYLFRLDKDDIIDATRTGGMARFINHCCEPNAYAKVVTTDWASHRSFLGSSSFGSGEDDGDSGASAFVAKHITILAARDIQEGEEITYDYKFPIEENKLRCYCGARSCQGSMN